MLEIKNVSVRYGEKEILRNVSFALRPQQLTVLVGRNGSGKSTLLSCVNQQTPYTGTISRRETDLARLSPRERAKRVAILPQILPSPHIPVKEMVAFGRNPYLDLTGRLTKQDEEMVASAMADARVETLAERYVDTLSGGERQRAALAMILAQDTPIALLDEPTAHMDQFYEEAFLRLLLELKEKKEKTFLVVLHDLNLAGRYGDDILVLDEGRLRFGGTKAECLAQGVIEETFGLKRYSVGDKVFFSAE